MSFSNPQLPLESLPEARTLDYQPLSPNYRWEVALQGLLSYAIPLVILIGLNVFGEDVEISIFGGYEHYALMAFTVLIVVSVGLGVYAATKKKLALREHDIAFQKGLIWRRTMVLPVTRIQHVELSTGPIERLFGHSTLKFFTAGGSAVDLKIPGLDEQRASRLRQWLLQRLGEEAVAGMQAASEPQ